jgi:uncharacterized iron-regulated membrane protein
MSADDAAPSLSEVCRRQSSSSPGQKDAAMHPNAPISLLTASYGTRNAAIEDFSAVWGARSDGDFHHTSIALLGKDAGGDLRIDRSNSTAKHLAWGGALLGGAMFVLAPATGVEMLATVGLTGAGAIIYHFRRNTDPEELAETALLLEAGAWGMVAVVVNRRGEELTPLLARAQRSSAIGMLWGALEEELCRDFRTSYSDAVLVAS